MEIKLIRGIQIAYDFRAAGDELVVFLHGVGADRTAWKFQIDAFADEGYSTVAVDMRGSGDSDFRDESGEILPITLEEFARDTDALIRSLGFSKAHWVGNSMGGVIIFKALDLELTSLDKIILCNTFAKYPTSHEHLPRASAALREKSLAEFARVRIPAVLKPDIAHDILEEAIHAMARKDPEAYLASWRATWSPDFREMLGSIRNQTLILSSTLDTATPVVLSEELAVGIPGARHITIKSAGHISNLDQPEEFNRAVKSFLKK
jgi:pimeloyl-ACP methyl ester carboxylesterase